MQNISIGECIRRRRKELKLTQEEVCLGICEVSTLSRIENGRHVPSRSKINALLQRLGLPEERYYALTSPNELEIEALKKEIVGFNTSKNSEMSLKYLQKLISIVEPDDHLTQQFIIRSKLLIGNLQHQYAPDEQISLLLRAIRLTQPDFSLSTISDRLYTVDEIKLINSIALVYSDLKQYSDAIRIHEQLLSYIEAHYSEAITSGSILQLVLFNYSRELGLNKQYQKSIEYAKKGQKSCIQYGQCNCLSGYLAIMAECYYYLGQIKESKECYTEAYYLCKALEQYRDFQIIQKEAFERIGLRFTD